MGWHGQNWQDAEERRLLHQLPFLQRYDWYRVVWVLFFVALLFATVVWR
jgi:hypothetical protein